MNDQLLDDTATDDHVVDDLLNAAIAYVRCHVRSDEKGGDVGYVRYECCMNLLSAFGLTASYPADIAALIKQYHAQ